MVEALRGNVAKARERLAGLGPHPTVPGYQRLAEAVLSVAEGNLAQAHAALEAWEMALTKSGMGAAVRIGNEWAVEAVRRCLEAATDQAMGSKA
jgi:hypothetical protein